MRRSLWLVALLGLTGLLGLAAAPSYASCAEDSGPEGSDVVFLGTADEERRGFTRFTVDEVWVGPDLADAVWVQTGQEQPPFPLYIFSAVASSTDADLVEGEAYVVGATSDFHTSACSVAEAGADLGALRPDDPRSPASDGSAGADPPIGPVESGAIVVGVVVLLWGLRLASRWRRIMGSRG